MKGTRKTSVRRLPTGSFLVSGVHSRSVLTGRFLTDGNPFCSPSNRCAACVAMDAERTGMEYEIEEDEG